ncbi:hypothetical protein ACFL3G_05870 [Planctomycetota bacterium]
MNIQAKKNEDLRIMQQERLILQICLHINKLMEEQKVSKGELARRLGVKPPRITQILDGVNLGLRQVSNVMLALDSGLSVDTGPIGFMTNLKPTPVLNLQFANFERRLNRKGWNKEAIYRNKEAI